MAFTNQQAIAVNSLLTYLLGPSHPEYGAAPMTGDKAKQAACELAKHANRALGAGWHEDLVARCWQQRFPEGSAA